MLMMTGKRPSDFGRKTSARRRVPSRIGISTSLSMRRSCAGTEPRARDFRTTAIASVDLDMVLVDEVGPGLRLGAHLLGPFLRRRGHIHRHELLREHGLHLGIVEHL